MSGTLLEHAFFVLCPRLDATDGIVNYEGQVNGQKISLKSKCENIWWQNNSNGKF